ncbi:MAG: precorrin-3B C(17)-methyltransferase [Hyphomicrobiales bacterium]
MVRREKPPAIVVLGPSAMPLARRLKSLLDGEIHGPKSLSDIDVGMSGVTDGLRSLFADGRPIVGLCASGILIRAVAPLLDDKLKEPAVVAMAEDGTAVVPLLGGHHGANDLARKIAEATGARAAITTATDLRFGFGLDSPPPGYELANPMDAKEFAARLLAGETVSVEGSAPWVMLASHPGSALEIRVTHEAGRASPDRLVFHPRAVAVGVGCERGVAADELIGLVENTLKAHRIATPSVALVASLDIKADEPAIHTLSQKFGVPARFLTAKELEAEADRLATPSDVVLAEVGVAGVAEAAALAAVGRSGTLVVAKTKSKRATCAVALASEPIDPEKVGAARGKLMVVGVGPGGPGDRSERARDALRTATDWVGYGLYLDLIADLKRTQAEHRFPLGAEIERARHAISHARQGRSVALVTSGDPGIYAMASLIFEILDNEPAPIALEVVPGISALQAASAHSGALIGHDFCCISLSDLLTPWPVIEERLKAAAEADFVIALYNPRSEKRRAQLPRALVFLKARRPAETPVVIASNVGRKHEQVRVVRLDEFDPSEVDMMTLVLVGSSQSKAFTRGDGRTYAYTPRGYLAR